MVDLLNVFAFLGFPPQTQTRPHPTLPMVLLRLATYHTHALEIKFMKERIAPTAPRLYVDQEDLDALQDVSEETSGCTAVKIQLPQAYNSLGGRTPARLVYATPCRFCHRRR